jgi:hypothetical protein
MKNIALPNNIFYDTTQNKGLRNNLAIEGLTFSKDSKSLWLSAESALIEDGVPANANITSPVRFSKINLMSGKLEKQLAYLPDRTPTKPKLTDDFSENGISEILMLANEKLLVLERSFTKGIGNSIRLYEADFSAADCLLLSETIPCDTKLAKKKLIADFSQFTIDKIDNIEAMAWGKKLENGNKTIIFVSDNNFSEKQITQILVFEFIEYNFK